MSANNEIKIIYDNNNDNNKAYAVNLSNIFTKFDKFDFISVIQNLLSLKDKSSDGLKIVINNKTYDFINHDFIDLLIKQLYIKGIEKITDTGFNKTININASNLDDIKKHYITELNRIDNNLLIINEPEKIEFKIGKDTSGNDIIIYHINNKELQIRYINEENPKKPDTYNNLLGYEILNLIELDILNFNQEDLKIKIDNLFDSIKLYDLIILNYKYKDIIKKIFVIVYINNTKVSFIELLNNKQITIKIDNIKPENIVSIKKISNDKKQLKINEYIKNKIHLINTYKDTSNDDEIIDYMNKDTDNQFIEINSSNQFIILNKKLKDKYETIEITKSVIPSSEDRLTGIYRDHNTCFLGTLIQMLRQIDEFYYYVDSIKNKDKDKDKGIFNELNEILLTTEINSRTDQMTEIRKKIVNTLFINDPEGQFGKQNDITDALVQLFNYIDVNNNDFRKQFLNLFNIYNIKFSYCDKYMESLQIDDPTHYITISLKTDETRHLEINDYLKFELNSHSLDINAHLSMCDDRKSFGKLMYIVTEHTKYIFISLKRFNYKNKNQYKMKNKVKITEYIELYDHNQELIKFKPICTGMHLGDTTRSGHYVFATLEFKNKEIVFKTIIDDDNIIEAPQYPGFDINIAPYLFLYQRADTIEQNK